jgi:hypothetical protein
MLSARASFNRWNGSNHHYDEKERHSSA